MYSFLKCSMLYRVCDKPIWVLLDVRHSEFPQKEDTLTQLTLNQYSILIMRLKILARQDIYHHDAYKFIVQHIYFDK